MDLSYEYWLMFGVMTFIAVIVLALLIILVTHIKSTKNQVLVQSRPVVNAPETSVKKVAHASNDEEIVAAITAAISMMLGKSSDQFVVTSFRKINSKTQWHAR